MATGIRLDPGALHDLLESPTGPIGKELLLLALRVEGKAKRLLSTPGTGRVYRRLRDTKRVRGLREEALLGGIGRGESMVRASDYLTHQASAPGSPPAVDVGRLRSSITHALEHDARGLYAAVGTNVEYAPWLELGTATIAARPFLRPALSAITGIAG